MQLSLEVLALQAEYLGGPSSLGETLVTLTAHQPQTSTRFTITGLPSDQVRGFTPGDRITLTLE